MLHRGIVAAVFLLFAQTILFAQGRGERPCDILPDLFGPCSPLAPLKDTGTPDYRLPPYSPQLHPHLDPRPPAGQQKPLTDSQKKTIDELNGALEKITRSIKSGNVVVHQPRGVEADILAGEFNMDNGRYSEAAEAYSRVIAVQPDNASAWMQRCMARTRLGDRNNGLADCTEATRLQPQNAAAHYNRAAVLENMDRIDEAIAATTSAINIAPGNANFRVLRCILHMRRDGTCPGEDFDAIFASAEARQRFIRIANDYSSRGLIKEAAKQEQKPAPARHLRPSPFK